MKLLTNYLSFLLIFLYSFSQLNAQWNQLGADIDGEAIGDNSGASVSLNGIGDRMAIGANNNDGNGTDAGHVRVYEWNGTAWVQLGADIDGEAANDQSGISVSMNDSGNRIAIGANGNSGNGTAAGHVRVYEWNGSAWIQLGADIDGEAAIDLSGLSVSMNGLGDRLAIGAVLNDGSATDAGHVRVYEWNGSAWIQLGTDLDGEAAIDQFGYSVSMNLSGDRLAIGANQNDGNGNNSGHVRVYEWNGTAWIQFGADIDGEAAADESGYSVSINSLGDRLAIGAIQNDGSGNGAGHVRVYEWNGTAWVQLGVDIDGEAAADQSGYSVSMNSLGDRLAIGAIENDGNGSNSGHARIYEWNGSAWIQLGADIDGEAANNRFGRSISMNSAGDLFAVGADFNNSNTGHVRAFEFVVPVYPEEPGSGYTLQFDGSSDISIPNSTEITNLNDYTYTAWLKFDNTGLNPFFSKYLSGNLDIEFYQSGTNLVVQHNSGNGGSNDFLTTNAMPAGEWNHLAIVHNAGNLEIFINGVSVLSNPIIPPLQSAYNIVLGSSATLPPQFNGQMDEVCIWNTPISQNLIREWMCKKLNASHPNFANLVSYYRFDENQGGTLFDLANGNDGTLNGGFNAASWQRSGAAIGDESINTYGGTSLVDTLWNGNEIALNNFQGSPNGVHLYVVNDTTTSSTFPLGTFNEETETYFGVHMVGGTSYDVSIDYTNNTDIEGRTIEPQIRGLKRDDNADGTWEYTSGPLSTNTINNTISLPNQSGTEYTTGFTNTVYPEEPGSGYAFQFDGINDRIDLGVYNPTDTFTIEAWIKPDAGTSSIKTIAGNKVSGLGTIGYLFYINSFSSSDRRLIFETQNQSIVSPVNTIIEDEWQHVAIVVQGNFGRLYHNGESVGTGVVNLVPSFGQTLKIGAAADPAFFWDGEIDEVRLWSDNLNQGTLRQYANQKVNANHPSFTNLELYYRADESSGTSVEDLMGNANGTYIDPDAAYTWTRSGAALGDTSVFAAPAAPINIVMDNGLSISITDVDGPGDNIALYKVEDTALVSTIPTQINTIDDRSYFGVKLVGGGTYSLEIDYSANPTFASAIRERNIRVLKRDNGADGTWQQVTSRIFVDIATNRIRIPGQSGTEYVLGFSNVTYPDRIGSGYALELDGSNESIDFPVTTEIANLNDYTYSAWVRFDNTTLNPIFSKRLGTAADIDIIHGLSGLVVSHNFQNTGPYNFTVGPVIPINEWNHIAVVNNAGNITIYLNGEGVHTATIATPLQSNFGFSIGSSPLNPSQFDGAIDEVRLWNTPLTQNLIREWMCRKLTARHDSINSLVAYYRFDEAQGDTLYDLARGNNGELINMEVADWQLSAAALGDSSIFSYPSGPLTYVFPNNDSIEITNGEQLYIINDTANNMSVPNGLDSLIAPPYFGIFTTDPAVQNDIFVYYGNTAIANDYEINLAKRTDNSDLTWNQFDLSLRQTAPALNAFAAFDQDGRGEYMLATGANNALDFDGVDDYIAAPSSPLLDIDSVFTISFWFKSNDINQAAANILQRGSNYSILFESTNDLIQLGTGVVNGVNPIFISGLTIPDTDWHFYAYAYDGTTFRGYRDSVELINTTVDFYLTPSVDSLRIGRNVLLTDFGNMQLDELRIWQRSLCDSEIFQYRDCENLNTNQLSLYYKFNQGIAEGNNNLINIIEDNSPNGLDATMFGYTKTGSNSNFVEGPDAVFDTCNNITVSPLVTSITQNSAVNCFGDSTTLTVNVSGGTGLYSFNWSSGDITQTTANLGPGNYTVTVSDGSCALPDTLSLTINSVIRKSTPADILNSTIQLGPSIAGLNDFVDAGESVSINEIGNRMAVSAPGLDFGGSNTGSTTIFEWDGASWGIIGSSINGEAIEDRSGFEIDLNDAGNRIAIGAHLNDGNGANSGHVRVFEWDGTSWNQMGADIDGEAAGDLSGLALELNSLGNRIVIGAERNDGFATDAGHARVFEWDGTNWIQLGLDIEGQALNDRAGTDVSINASGDRIAVGAKFNDGSAANAGNTRIYDWDGSNWIQIGLDIQGEAANDESGATISLNKSGDRIAIGARLNDGNGAQAGHARVFEWSLGSWNQIGADLDGDAAGDLFGFDVKLNYGGDLVLIGATAHDGTNSNGGLARAYKWNGANWNQVGADIGGEFFDSLGTSVDINGTGDIFAVGSPGFDGAGIDYGRAQLLQYTVESCGDFVWAQNSQTYNASGTYYDTLISANGCDSLVSLNLIINNNSFTTIVDSACASYFWESTGLIYTSSGAYNDTLVAANGCDSILTLNLTIYPLPTATIDQGDTAQFCFSDSITLRVSGNADAYQWYNADSTTWNYWKGQGFSATGTSGQELKFLGSVAHIVYNDPVNNGVTVQYDNGTYWDTLGSVGFNGGAADYPNIDFVGGVPYVAYKNVSASGRASVAQFNGGIWTSVGPLTITANSAEELDMVVINNEPYIAYRDGATFALNVLKYNGTSWVNVGLPNFSAGAVSELCIAAYNNEPYVAFRDAANVSRATVMRYDGNSWVNVGGAASPAGVRYLDLDFDQNGNPHLIYQDGANSDQASVSYYNGAIWQNLGPAGFSGNGVDFTNIEIDGNTPYVSYYDQFLSNTVVRKYNGSTWELVGREGFSGVASDQSLALNFGFPFVGFRDNTSAGRTSVMAFINPVISNADSLIVDTAGTFAVLGISSNECLVWDTITVIQGDSLIASIALDSNVSCNGFSDGGLTAFATGGIPPYTYNWSNTSTTSAINGLVSGVYTVTITDAIGCTDSASIIITQPLALSITMGGIDETCNLAADGQAGVVALGGTSPYTYLWSNASTTATINSISAGLYRVTVTDNNGCVDIDSVSITVNDTIAPVALAQNIIIYLDNAGSYFLDSTEVNDGSSDNCAIASYEIIGQRTYGCADIAGTTPVQLAVFDTNGNSDTSASVNVTVEDTIPPNVITQNINGYLDAFGQFNLLPGDIDNGSTDNCSSITLSIDSSNFNCNELGLNTVTLFAEDASGNRDSSTATVNILDTIAPILTTNNIVVYLNPNGVDTVGLGVIRVGALNEACAHSYNRFQFIYDCNDLGVFSDTLIASDLSGNSDTSIFMVDVRDTIQPIAVSNDTTIYLDASGFASVTALGINNGSTDNCSIVTYQLDSTNFDCSEVGVNTVELVVLDADGNSDTTTAQITVLDTVRPNVVTRNITVSLGANGTDTIIVADIDNGSIDECGIANRVLSKTVFDCDDVGLDTVTLVVTDNNGNIDSAIAEVTVVDTWRVSAFAQSITVFLDSNGFVAIDSNAIDAGSSDNCAIAQQILSQDTFNCTNLDSNLVSMILIDPSGNRDTASDYVIVRDIIRPIAMASDTTLFLDINGFASITALDLNVGSTDNCSIVTYQLDSTNFDCSEIGTNTVEFLVVDASGNRDSVTAIVTVRDTIDPLFNAYNDTTVNNDLGSCDAIVNYPLPSFIDNCSGGIIRQLAGLASGQTFPLGATTNTFEVEDAGGNFDTISFVVTVVDNEPAVINGTPTNFTVNNDAGQCGALVNWVAPTASDNCLVDSLISNASPNSFFPVGDTTITYIAYEPNGLNDTTSFVITVVDNEFAVISGTPANITVNSDAGQCGAIVNWTVPTASDNCAVDSLVSNASPSSFFPVGDTTITYIAYEPNGLNDTTSFVITVVDNEFAVISGTPNSFTVNNDPGQCGAIVNWIAPTASDNCVVDSLVSNASPSSFFPVGDSTITYIAYEPNGLNDTTSFVITVVDNEPAVISGTPTNITVNNDAGQCGAVVSWILPTASDNCSVISLISNASPNDFFPIGDTTITYIAIEPNGLNDTASFVITVVDNEPAVINGTPTNFTVNNDAGQCGALVNWVAPTASDNCLVDSLISNASPNSFFPVGDTTITYIAYEPNGLNDTTSFVITVVDNEFAVISGTPANITVNSDAGQCGAIVNWTVPTASDNCAVDSLVSNASPSSFFPVGDTTITYIAYEPNGLNDTTSFVITVVDNEFAVISGTPNSFTVNNDPGQCGAIVNWIAPTASDNCVVDSLVSNASPSSFFPVGDTTITYIAYEPNGLNDTTSFVITVVDNEPAVISGIPTNITVNNDAGQCGAVVSWILPTASDNCSVISLISNASPNDFFPIGDTTITYIAIEPNGLNDTASFVITVVDSEPAVINGTPTNFTVNNDAGQCGALVNWVAPTASDNCLVDSLISNASPNSFFPVGDTTITYIAYEPNGLNDTTSFVITVNDTELPSVLTQDTVVYLDANGVATIDSSYINNGSSDNCGIQNIVLDVDSFGCNDISASPIIVNLTVTDVYSNINSASALVSVRDTIRPLVITQNITVQLDVNGQASITAADIDNGSGDNCGIQSLSIDINSFDCSDINNPVSVTLTAVDVNNNSSSSRAIVTVVDPIQPTQADAGIDQVICSNNSVMAANSPSIGSGQWLVVNGTGTFSDITSPTSTVSGLSIGRNTFEWVISTTGCNESRDTLVIQVDENPTPADAGDDQLICDFTSATLNAVAPTVGLGQWSIGTNGSGNIVSPNSRNSSVNGLRIGRNQLVWTTTNGVCPSSSDITIVTVSNTPIIDAGPDLTIFRVDGAQLNVVSTPSEGVSYQWSPAFDIVTSSTIANPFARPERTTEFVVTVTDSLGCFTSDSVIVTVEGVLVIPTAFTPNNDGFNDSWEIKNLDGYASYKVSVFNGFGVKLFSTSNYEPWDGRFNGEDLPVGSYYFVIELETFNGDNTVETGIVSIIK